MSDDLLPEDLLPDEWWTKLADEEAQPVIVAAQCLIKLRLMALKRRMQDIIAQMKRAESSRQDVTQISIEYNEALTKERELMSRPGQLRFIDKLLEAYYEKKKQSQEALPL